MPVIPRTMLPDSSVPLLRDPYRFISRQCAEFGTDLFETRLLLRKTICMTGDDAAKVFYDPGLTQRAGAAPGRLQKTLFGRGGVQGLDGEAHALRKQFFTELVQPKSVARLAGAVARHWRANLPQWRDRQTVVLYDALQEILAAAVCEWTGVPLRSEEATRRTRELTALFDAAGSAGPRHWYARLARKRANRWIGSVIEAARSARLEPEPASALARIAAWRDAAGNPLDNHTAAVELLNVIRPAIAVSVYIVFCAHALHRHPESRERLIAADKGYMDRFVEETRRVYPFFPAVIARVARNFEWKGYPMPAGYQLVLDLYGTNHDPRIWDDPEAFRPDRFQQTAVTPFNFIPQGGGDAHLGHRCPGEPIARELMKAAVGLLVHEMQYEVPEQDLAIDFQRLPALPNSRFVLRQVRINP